MLPTYDFGFATWVSKCISWSGSFHNLNSIIEPVNWLPNWSLGLPPINKSPLPVHEALNDCDAVLDPDISNDVLDENIVLSNPLSYFLTYNS